MRAMCGKPGSLLLMLAAMACNSIALAGGADMFTPTGSLNTGRENTTATALTNGQVLVVGGEDNSATPIASAELYDPSTGRFSLTGSMSTPRVNDTATLLASGKVLIVGGTTGLSGAFDSAEVYDPATGTFSLTTGRPVLPRVYARAVLLNTGKVLIAGGANNNGTVYAGAELYDPATDTFSATGSMAAARGLQAMVVLSNGTVLVAGGDGEEIIGSAEIYDPSTGTFSPTGSLVAARAYATGTLLANGKVLVAGGEDIHGYPRTAELYDPASGTFAMTGSMSSSRLYDTATLLPTGEVLMAGGLGGDESQSQATAELYDPVSGTFSLTGSMSTTRAAASAALLPNGQVLVAGGAGVTFGQSSADLYATCGSTPVDLSILPLTQSVNQDILFSTQLGINQPFGGTVSFIIDGAPGMACSTTVSDVTTACSAALNLGTHSVFAFYSGNGFNPSGCTLGSVTVIQDTTPTITSAALASNPAAPTQGNPITLTATISTIGNPGAIRAADTAFSGFVTFYNGTIVLAQVPLTNNQATYTNTLAAGNYDFSATYSGDAQDATSAGSASITVTKPTDDIFYDGLEIPPGN